MNYKPALCILDTKLDLLSALPELLEDEAKKIDNYYRIKEVYSSNAIEGNTLTENETALILNDDAVVPGKSVKEHKEIINLNRALDLLNEFRKADVEVTEDLIKRIHEVVTCGLLSSPLLEGEYRTRGNRVGGSCLITTPPNGIQKEMKELIEWYNSNKGVLHPVELAVIFKYRLVSIHPFVDGNGRVSRLMMNYILTCQGYPNVIIDPLKNKLAYYEALEAGHRIGKKYECLELIVFIANTLIDLVDEQLELLSEGVKDMKDFD